MTKALRVILIGGNPAGRGGEWADAMRAEPAVVELVGVCDFIDSHAAHWAPLPFARTATELFARGVVADAAVLAVPPAVAATVREECLRAGLTLLHEKPVACRLTEVLSTQQAITDRGARILVAVQRRSHPTYQALQQLLRASPPSTLVLRLALGRPATEATGGFRGDRVLAGGGALLDLGYHAIDLVHFLLDVPIEVVSSDLWNGSAPARERELETAAVVVGRCGPTWVRIEIDRCGEKEEFVEAMTPVGTVRADRSRLTVSGVERLRCEHSWVGSMRAMLHELLRLHEGEHRSVSLWDHLAVLSAVERAYALAPGWGLGSPGVIT